MTIGSFPSLVDLQRRIGRFPIEIPAAAAIGGAIMFVTMALPDWRLEAMVAASGLPGLVSAAQPPLGQTARLLVALFLGALASLGVWAALRALDRPTVRSSFPAFRTADLHPDAPRRRPILAGVEFGTPVDEGAEVGAAGHDAPLRRRALVMEDSLPSFLAPQPPAIGDFVPEPLETTEPQVAAFQEVADDDPDAGQRSEPAMAAVPTFMQPVPSSSTPDDTEAAGASNDDESVAYLMARLENGLTRRGSKPEPGALDIAKEEIARALDDLDLAAPGHG